MYQACNASLVYLMFRQTIFWKKIKPIGFVADSIIVNNQQTRTYPMVDSISGLTNVAVALQQQKTAQQVNIAVLNKAQDVQQQQGQAVLQLLDSANIAQGVDVHV